mmetsp:Transcript_24403/g.24127  ORF Transcript_24403/g.24127 Transcript_24403/m.24127 type:complete len:83 (-) Transcript_24403:4-252(-)
MQSKLKKMQKEKLKKILMEILIENVESTPMRKSRDKVMRSNNMKRKFTEKGKNSTSSKFERNDHQGEKHRKWKELEEREKYR